MKAQIDQIWQHIRHVQDNAYAMGKELIQLSEDVLGRTLIANALRHDSSKFRGIEWDHLVRGDELLHECVRHHNHTNEHHPEYWGGIEYMPDVFIAEMVCDWCARSQEMGTSVREWIAISAKSKYQIVDGSEVDLKIKRFLALIVEDPFG